jgi:glucokinase
VALALAVDIGGTKLAAGLVDDEGRLLESERVPTPRGSDAEELFAALTRLVDDVRARAETAPRVCGVGTGGPMTAHGEEVSPLNIAAWRGFPLRSRLSAHLGLETFVDNDAKALALGEGWVGAARDADSFVAMVVSTGVGGGIVLGRKLVDGEHGNAGHIGHVIVEPGGLLCPCGARGCLEAEASGTAIRTSTGHQPSDAPKEVRRRTGRLVGRAVASVANLLDLRFAVVAGSVALGYGADFFGAAQEELDRSARLEFSRGATIVPGQLGGEGPLVGAAAVGWRGAGHDIGIA